MNTSGTWGIRYDASAGAGHYWLFERTPAGEVVFPGVTTARIELDDAGIAIAQGSFTLTFDGWGRPACPEIPFDGNRRLTLTLSQAGADSRQLTVAQNTGFIQWQ